MYSGLMVAPGLTVRAAWFAQAGAHRPCGFEAYTIERYIPFFVSHAIVGLIKRSTGWSASAVI